MRRGRERGSPGKSSPGLAPTPGDSDDYSEKVKVLGCYEMDEFVTSCTVKLLQKDHVEKKNRDLVKRYPSF